MHLTCNTFSLSLSLSLSRSVSLSLSLCLRRQTLMSRNENSAALVRLQSDGLKSDTLYAHTILIRIDVPRYCSRVGCWILQASFSHLIGESA